MCFKKYAKIEKMNICCGSLKTAAINKLYAPVPRSPQQIIISKKNAKIKNEYMLRFQ